MKKKLRMFLHKMDQFLNYLSKRNNVKNIVLDSIY